jgi:DNA polymerase III subunit alpha
MAFAHLHVHSQFSLLDGAIPIKKLAPAVEALGQNYVAITDHCNMFGAISLDKSCKGTSVKAVFGCGLWVQPPERSKESMGPREGDHILVLIENEEGYHNLCALITDAIYNGMQYKPTVSLESLKERSGGLIALTSGVRGPVRPYLLIGDDDSARVNLTKLKEIFGPDNLYVELQNAGFEGDLRVNSACKALASELGLQTVVTNAVHYLTKQDAPTLELLQCIGQGESLNDPERQRPVTDQLYLKSEEEMRALFPDDLDACDRTVEIAERCNYKFIYDQYYFPASSPPDTDQDTERNFSFFYKAFPPAVVFGLPDPDAGLPPMEEGCGTLDGYLAWYSKVGLEHRLTLIDEGLHESYRDRMIEELGIINSMGFPAYFLIVAEFINWAKDRNIPVGPGRGSAAGSIVAWALRITDIDPIRFDLLFERFLNPERISMPDIDIDFAQDRREEVIQHTRDKYGKEFVSQIITYGKLQAKLAIRDVARVCDMNFMAADRIAKLVPDELGITLEKALKEDELGRLVSCDPSVRRVLQMAQRVEGLTRQTGIHAAGVVIGDRPLVELAPLYRDGPEGGPVVQYDMKSAESIGLIKFDFLGLKTLDQIRDAVALIERNTGEVIDMALVDEADPKTFELLQRGDGLGVFQVESSGMRDLLSKLKPTTLEDLVALVALFRPGPLSAGMVDDFIDRKHGRQEVSYMLPELEPILKNTYGVVVYQEQVMRIAQVLASYSLGEADLLRRAMGKKNHEEMAKQKVRFLDGADKNGVDLTKAEEIFDLLAMFAAYGFNKSHSAAYGYISYQTAWLKANYRTEYMAALMTIESNNTDKVVAYIGDCRKANVEVLPPCVNNSFRFFDVPADNRQVIRFGLAAVKNVGGAAVDAIVEARESAGGKFSSLMDCFERINYGKINKRVLQNLIKCGAFDWTGERRSAMLAGLEGLLKAGQRSQADKNAGQVSLFGGMAMNEAPSIRLPDVLEWPVGKLLAFERDSVGFFLSGHPVEGFVDEVERYSTCKISLLSRQPSEKEVSVAGMPSSIKVIRTKRGDKMAFVALEDDTGDVECIFFAEPFSNSVKVLKSGRPIMLKGKMDSKGDEPKILAESVELLSELRERGTKEVQISIRPDEINERSIIEFQNLLRASPGKCPVRVLVEYPARKAVTVKLSDEYRVVPDDQLSDGISVILHRADAVRFR